MTTFKLIDYYLIQVEKEITNTRILFCTKNLLQIVKYSIKPINYHRLQFQNLNILRYISVYYMVFSMPLKKTFVHGNRMC